MSGQNNKVHDPTSLASWQAHNTMTVMLTKDLGFEVKHLDILAWMNAKKGNPLLVKLQEALKAGSDNIMQEIGGDSDSREALSAIMNELLIEIVVSPPLTEQDNKPEESISLMNVSLGHKMQIIGEMTGGEQFAQMGQFRGEPASSVVAAPTGDNLS